MELSTILIAIGTGACRISQRKLSGKAENSFQLLFVDHDKNAVEDILQTLMSDTEVHNKHIILFSTLGRTTGCVYTSRLAERLAEGGIAYKSVFSLPFQWEGRGNMRRAISVLHSVEKYGHPVFILCNDLLSEEDESSLLDVLELNENRMIALIERLIVNADVMGEESLYKHFYTCTEEIMKINSFFLQNSLSKQELPVQIPEKREDELLTETFCISVHQLGLRYYEKQNFSKALLLLTLAAEEGYAGDELLIAEMYEEGMGTTPNKEKSLEWYIRAAMNGSPVAQFNVGFYYEMLSDFTKAVEWYSIAAKSGNTDALCNLGDLYGKEGIWHNDRKSLRCFRKAAMAKVPYAQYKLGSIYESGKGAEQDYFQAFQWYLKASDQHYFPAYMKLKAMYERGLLELSRKKRFKWKSTDK